MIRRIVSEFRVVWFICVIGLGSYVVLKIYATGIGWLTLLLGGEYLLGLETSVFKIPTQIDPIVGWGSIAFILMTMGVAIFRLVRWLIAERRPNMPNMVFLSNDNLRDRR
jgi:hypothetical protein